MKKLKRLMLFLYYLDHGAWMYRDHVNPSTKEVLDWEVGVVDYMMMQCFE